MKFNCRFLLALAIGFYANVAYAQNNASVSDLLKQGQAFCEKQQYNEAVIKYREALSAEPDNAQANYELAYALYSVNKGAEGVPYLEKALANAKNVSFTAGAYSLLGSIYSANNQFQKSIEAYKNGIKADSTNQRLIYNLGITQYRARQYADAEQSFLSAVKLDTAYAASQRMYALAAFHQNKRAEALLGICRFLMIDPSGPQSAEAFGNLQNILSGGFLKPEPGFKVSAEAKLAADVQNKLMAKALAGFATRRYASATELLTQQLKAVFGALGSMPDAKYPFAGYFFKLAQTEHLPTFVRVISQKAIPENVQWVKANEGQITAYNQWVSTNKLSF